METCLHRKGEMCEISVYPKPCKRDYTNHLNNKNCPRYYEINIMEFEVQNVKKPENYFRKFILDSPKPNSSAEGLLRKLM